MKPETALRTDRLELVAATLEHLHAELAGPTALAALLAAQVPGSWPPGEYDRDVLEYFRSRLAETPEAVGWYGWYVISPGADGSRQSLVAGAGFLGPPSPGGVVEIGYSVVPGERGRGYASEAVRALLAHAFRHATVERIVATTTDSNVGASAVLIQCGFRRVGAAQAQASSTYERTRSAAPPAPTSGDQRALFPKPAAPKTPMQKVTPFLSFDGQAEEAARFYISLLPESRIDRVIRSPMDTGGGAAGTVLMVEFTLAGTQYVALNAPKFAFTGAVSFMIACADQAETDRLWAALTAHGGSEVGCGWLKDRWGVSWQVTPTRLLELVTGPDQDRAARALASIGNMRKINIAEVERAADGR